MSLPTSNFFEAIKILQLGSREEGVSFSELEQYGLSRERVLWHLEVFPTIELPPFYPDDILDVEVLGDRIHLFSTLPLTTPINLSEIDLLALSLALQWGARSNLLDPMEASALIAKMEKCRPERSVSLDVEGTRIFFADDIEGTRFLERIESAIQRNRCLSLTYYSKRQGETSRREVWPYRIYLRAGVIYLRAFQPENPAQDEGWRSFRLDRVRDVDLLDSCFNPKSFPEPEEGEKLFVFDSVAKTKTRTRFYSTSAKYIAELFQNGSAHWTGDDRIELEYEVIGFPYYRAFVLQFGHQAETLAPEHFREAVADHLHRILVTLT